MDIRRAVPADLDAIAGLYLKNHKTTYRDLLPAYVSGLTPAYCREKWDAFLRDGEKRVWAAYDEGVFLGFAAGMPDTELSGTWYLEALHVAESARGRGVGSALICAAAASAAQQGFTRMSVCIIRGNERAGGLYRKLGAAHYAYFEDDFHGTRTSSEKLLWEALPISRNTESL